MNSTILVVADDGSTSTKLAWFEAGVLQVRIVSNAAELGVGFGDESDKTFFVEGESLPFTFFEAANAIRSKSEAYQYAPHSVAAIHHALIEAGFAGKTVTVAATLPLEQFYSNGRTNKENVARKKCSVLRKVSPEDAEAVTIAEVIVYPEGIPAVFSRLIDAAGQPLVDDDELTFLCDMGGTTLDLCLFSGAAKKIISAKSYNVGMFDTFDAVRAASGNTKARDIVVKRLLETGQAKGGKIKIDRAAVTSEVMKQAANLIVDFLADDMTGLSHCFCIGGGAELLSAHLENVGLKPEVVKEPVGSLAMAIAEIEHKKGRG